VGIVAIARNAGIQCVSGYAVPAAAQGTPITLEGIIASITLGTGSLMLKNTSLLVVEDATTEFAGVANLAAFSRWRPDAGTRLPATGRNHSSRAGETAANRGEQTRDPPGLAMVMSGAAADYPATLSIAQGDREFRITCPGCGRLSLDPKRWARPISLPVAKTWESYAWPRGLAKLPCQWHFTSREQSWEKLEFSAGRSGAMRCEPSRKPVLSALVVGRKAPRDGVERRDSLATTRNFIRQMRAVGWIAPENWLAAEAA